MYARNEAPPPHPVRTFAGARTCGAFLITAAAAAASAACRTQRGAGESHMERRQAHTRERARDANEA